MPLQHASQQHTQRAWIRPRLGHRLLDHGDGDLVLHAAQELREAGRDPVIERGAMYAGEVQGEGEKGGRGGGNFF